MLRNLLTFLLIAGLNNVLAQKIHSHNDYVQARPFWEAYESGAKSIEADVYLIDGKLYVAHEKNEINPERTLEKLYLEPLNKVVKARKRQELQILIDLKTNAEPTLRAVEEAISKYPKLANAHSKKKYIKFVISGNRPPISEYTKYPNYIFFDHQSLKDLSKGDKSKIALVSFSFGSYSKWKGDKPMTDEEKLKLKTIIDSVHTYGYPIRFWATPDTPLAWKTLFDLTVDFINTDQPKACKSFINK
jgi:alkaline phosphatase